MYGAVDVDGGQEVPAEAVAYLGISFEGGVSTNSVEDREKRGTGGSSPLVRDSGGSCSLVLEISFPTVKFSNFWYFKTIYDDNQFTCHC